MLNNVLGDYLDNVSEREFDFPQIALLRAMGFYDIHFTHGQVEFGKDFIAKRLENENVIQYSFQLKAGNISQAIWRKDIQGQVLEAVISGLSHPNFDRSLSHQSILVITGRLSGNAALGMQNLNENIVYKFQERAIILWDRETLIDFLISYGLEEFYSITSSGHMGYGDFHILYGKSLNGYISEREIENHSRKWLADSVIQNKRILGAILESEILSQNCKKNGFIYESIHAQLTFIRLVLFELNNVSNHDDESLLREIFNHALENLNNNCSEYITCIQEDWEKNDCDLTKMTAGSGSIFTYMVTCARIIETAGLNYFLTHSTESKKTLIDFIVKFIINEPGCSHLPSDWYAVSLVFPVLALKANHLEETAIEFLHRITVWLCNRYEQGDGIAGLGASPVEEITTLFGSNFDFIKTQKTSDSFLATVLSDLVAFIENEQLYCDVINDIKASKIFPTYWQIPDTEDIFLINGRGIISYPNVEYEDQMNRFIDYNFAQHIIHEVKSFNLCKKVDPIYILILMLLLRDRYFPKLWPLVI